MKKKIPLTQLTAWLMVATSAPLLSMAGKAGWTSAVFSAAICLMINSSIAYMGQKLPEWVRGLELAWTVLLLGTITAESTTCWQNGTDLSLLPLALMITAAFAARRGVEQAARSGAVLLWIVVPGVLVVLLAGVRGFEIERLVSCGAPNIWMLMPVFLLPVIGRNFIAEKTVGIVKLTLTVGLAAVGVIMWIVALMPQQNEMSFLNTFYEYSKGITLFGVAKRFEVVTACLLTCGWFALLTFLFASIYETIEAHRTGWGRGSVWYCTAIALLTMYNLPITMTDAGFLTLIFWGILPLLTQIIGGMKKSMKWYKRP